VKRVLLLATTTGYQIRSFGEAADRLGVRLVFASDRCDRLDDPWWDSAIPVKFHDMPSSIEAVVAAGRGQATEERLDGVIAVGDRPTALAAHVAAALGLRGNPPDAAATSRNKLATRRAFAAAGLLTPRFEVVSISEASPYTSLPYPVVIKPLALSGSQGVIRADDDQSFATAIDRVSRLLRTTAVSIERESAHGYALIETFIPGKEYAVEGVLTDGVLQVFTIFDKPDPLDGPFFEETIYLTPSTASADTQEAIVGAIAESIRILGLRHGPVHAECRVNDQGIYVLEVAARPIGGLCSKAIRFAGQDGSLATLEEVLLRHALGESIERYRRINRATGVMMIPIPRRGVYRGVSGVEKARRIAGVDDVIITAKPDSTLVPLPEGRSYLGFIFATADTPASVEDALRCAHDSLEFRIERDVIVTQ
jgi:predicted ATP-grasp superfamily ATP-dependent carboligase